MHSIYDMYTDWLQSTQAPFGLLEKIAAAGEWHMPGLPMGGGPGQWQTRSQQFHKFCNCRPIP